MSGPLYWLNRALRIRAESGDVSGAAHAQAELDDLRDALRVYGGHVPPCVGRPCECGFRGAWERAGLSMNGREARDADTTSEGAKP